MTLFNRIWAKTLGYKSLLFSISWLFRLQVECDHIDKICEVHSLARVPCRHHLAACNLPMLSWGCISDGSSVTLLLMLVESKTIVVGNSYEKDCFSSRMWRPIHPTTEVNVVLPLADSLLIDRIILGKVIPFSNFYFKKDTIKALPFLSIVYKC